ncbi:MAG TPA: hypothetical protein VNO43_11055, partial [Candidatus Eisenbacteria bacterium]|nr:hypothetical protein [Candidatus Eisenbacteria bacterium]
ILLIPGVGNALIEGGFASNSGAIAVVLSADATQQTLATADEFGRSFDWLAGAAEGSDFERRVPICR